MPESNNRKFKVLGVAWLGLGGLGLAYIFISLLVYGFAPVLVLLGLVFGTIGMVNGLVLLRRNPIARPLLAVSSVALLVPSAALFGLPLLVVAPSLWLTMSRGGKKALESYMARENG